MQSPKEKLEYLLKNIEALGIASIIRIVVDHLNFQERKIEELQGEIQILKSMKRDDDNARRN